MKKMVVEQYEVNIPDYYEQIDPMPEDPEGSVVFRTQTENARCFLIGFPVDYSQSLPRNQKDLIAGIRSFLGKNQGIVQAETADDYAFSIVKALLDPHGGVQYIFTFQKFYEDGILNIQGVFEEGYTTGIRDTIVFEMCLSNNLVSIEENNTVGWTRDPYDQSITEGALMNLSEEEDFDELFPDFPLTLCRELIKAITG